MDGVQKIFIQPVWNRKGDDSMAYLPPVIEKMYHEKSLHDLDFFAMTNSLDWSQQGDDNLVLEPLIQYLTQWPDEVIFVFEDKMAELLYRLDRPDIARRAYRTDRYFSGDGFLYARCVALVNGRAYYQKILDGRKKLDGDMEFEAILYAPGKAWARKHHRDPAEYPHIASPDYETGSNRACWQEENLWKEHDLSLGWSISVPGNWKREEGDGGETVLYPPKSELTVRITPFHTEKSGKPAPAKVMEQAFLQTIPSGAAGMKPEGYGLAGFRSRFFENRETGEGAPMCHIYAGYFAKGELLSANIFGRSREECVEAMEVFQTLQKNGE